MADRVVRRMVGVRVGVRVGARVGLTRLLAPRNKNMKFFFNSIWIHLILVQFRFQFDVTDVFDRLFCRICIDRLIANRISGCLQAYSYFCNQRFMSALYSQSTGYLPSSNWLAVYPAIFKPLYNGKTIYYIMLTKWKDFNFLNICRCIVNVQGKSIAFKN